MEKTSVYLTDAERRRLARLAKTTGRSQSALIREAIAAYEPATGDRQFAMTGIAEGPGDSVAEVPEETLLNGFGE